uniref:Uncharacterized protein n=1 Tax=viral metagenome TaxID=1070528 RepID=A0A6M3L3Q1_9ZZZZ
MRKYYEALEIVSMDEEIESVRIDITDMTDEEKATTLAAIKDIMSGKTYKLTEHICYHDGIPPNKSCEVKEL